jgi:uncharacterized protein YceK
MSYRREWRKGGRVAVKPGMMTASQSLKLMLVIFAIIALIVLLSGCVTTWSRAGATQADLARDTAQCQYETDRATAAIDNPVHAGVQDSLLNASCMKARGWRR